MRQHRNCSLKKCEVKLQEHLNHVAGREGTPKTGKTCEAVSEGKRTITNKF